MLTINWRDGGMKKKVLMAIGILALAAAGFFVWNGFDQHANMAHALEVAQRRLADLERGEENADMRESDRRAVESATETVRYFKDARNMGFGLAAGCLFVSVGLLIWSRRS